MARSHLCGNCGLELGLLAAQREPHYGFPIVRCPRCESVWVRRHAELDRVLRLARKAAGAAASAGGSLLLGGFCLMAWLIISITYTNEALRMGFPMVEVAGSLAGGGWNDLDSSAGRWRSQNLHVIAIAAGCIAVATGAVLTVLLGHLRRVWVWGMAITALTLSVWFFHAMHRVELADVRSGVVAGRAVLLDGSMLPYFNGVYVLELVRVQGLMAVAAIAGVPLGRVARMRLNKVRLWMISRLKATRRRSRNPN